MFKAFWFLFVALIVLLSGCGNEKNSDGENSDLESNDYTYDIKLIEKEGIRDIINNRDGKVLFINVWATWCVPCVEEFPDIVKLDDYYSDDQVEILSLSVDLMSDVDPLVIPFLKKQNAYFPVYIVNEKKSEEVIEFLNENWSGAVPATFIYDTEGKQREFFVGAKDFDFFKEKIDGILKDS